MKLFQTASIILGLLIGGVSDPAHAGSLSRFCETLLVRAHLLDEYQLIARDSFLADVQGSPLAGKPEYAKPGRLLGDADFKKAVYDGRVHAGKSYLLLDLVADYLGESSGQSLAFEESNVTYVPKFRRGIFKAGFQDGLICDVRGKPLNGDYIFVMADGGDFYVTQFTQSGRFHHSSLADGQAVAAAGELEVNEGRIELISRHSGHYRPPLFFIVNQAVPRLSELGADLSDLAVRRD